MNRRQSQIHAVAERRYGDACALRDTNHGERATGTIYLAGLAIEIALKAQLLAAYPWLSGSRSRKANLRGKEAWIHDLYWKLHDLDGLAHEVPGTLRRIKNRGGAPLVQRFKRICSEWRIEIRYRSDRKTIAEAAQFLAVAKEVKECLRS